MEDTKVEEGFKRCSRCGEVKPKTEFHKDKLSKDGLQRYCKQCHKAMLHESYVKNRGERLKKHADYYQSNKDEIKAYHAEWYQTHRESELKKHADYYQSNKEAISQKHAEYRANNKAAIAQKQADYYQANKDAIRKQQAEYYQANKDKIAEYRQANKDKIADYYDQQTHPLNWAKIMVNGYRKMDRDRFGDDSQTISAEWFLQHIANQPCVHCGVQGIGKVGCNRLDNTKCHTIDNVEPCCKSCNARENIRDQIERGVHISQLRKKQSFKDFVNEHKAKDKNLT